jgi:O-antigen ligase
MVNVVRTEKRLKALLLAALGASCFLSLAALNDYRLGHLGLEGTRILGTIGGMFENPNDLALHLVTMIPLATALLLATRSIFIKLLYAVCATLIVLGIVSTFSRGGVLGLAVTGFVLAFKLVPKLRILVAFLFLSLLFGAIAVAPNAFRQRLFTTQDASAVSRTDDLKRSIFLAVRHPVFGLGMSNYVHYSNQAKATHNAYTQVAAEIGIAGLAFYVLFLTAPLRPLRRIERETLHEKKRQRFYYLSIGVQAAIIGYMVCSFFASVAYLWYVYYLVAYAVCLRRIYQTTQRQSANNAVTISRK